MLMKLTKLMKFALYALNRSWTCFLIGSNQELRQLSKGYESAIKSFPLSKRNNGISAGAYLGNENLKFISVFIVSAKRTYLH